MGLCGTRSCNCAIQSDSLQITGDGSGGNPYNLESTGLTVVTSSTRPGPSERFLSQQILETDTSRIYYWDGSDWRIQVDPEAHFVVSHNPSGNVSSAGTGSYADWVTYSTTIGVPDWAARADIITTISQVWSVTSDLYVDLRMQIGSQFSPGQTFFIGTTPVGLPRAFADTMVVTPGTLQPVVIETRNLLGNTSAIRANAASAFRTYIHFKEF